MILVTVGVADTRTRCQSLGVVVIVVLALSCSGAPTAPDPVVEPSPPLMSDSGLAAAHTEARRQRILCRETGAYYGPSDQPALESLPALVRAAQDVVSRNARNAPSCRPDYDPHRVDGTTGLQRVRAAGWSGPFAENLACGQPTATAVVTSWLASDRRHCENIYWPQGGAGSGIGCARDGPWWGCVYGNPVRQ